MKRIDTRGWQGFHLNLLQVFLTKVYIKNCMKNGQLTCYSIFLFPLLNIGSVVLPSFLYCRRRTTVMLPSPHPPSIFNLMFVIIVRLSFHQYCYYWLFLLTVLHKMLVELMRACNKSCYRNYCGNFSTSNDIQPAVTLSGICVSLFSNMCVSF